MSAAANDEYSNEFDKWAADDEAWDTETGAPGIVLFGNALQVWSLMQRHPVSVADASRAFNLSAARIIEAVEDHYWMLLTGPRDDYERLMIEHDGE